MNVTEYITKEYDHAQVLYHHLSEIKTLDHAQKAAGLKLLDEQLDVIEQLNPECGTPEEERKLSFIIRTIAAARRSCLE